MIYLSINCCTWVLILIWFLLRFRSCGNDGYMLDVGSYCGSDKDALLWAGFNGSDKGACLSSDIYGISTYV